MNEDRFKVLVRTIGETNHLQTREKGNLVLGQGPLPLHTDGIFVGHLPDLILLYASEFSDQPGSGKTIVVDQQKVVEEMPKSLRDMLEKNMFEYQIQKSGHYGKQLSDKWLTIPPIRTQGGRESLNVAMQSPPDIERS